MSDDTAALYSAYVARDPRFDGVFYVGVTSTGIYCRPVCPAKTPRAANCRFFPSAEAAEKAAFRPCLRCRPELAPGRAPVDDAHRLATLIANRIDKGVPDDGGGLEDIASQFGYSARQIRRIVRKELGVSPIELVLTRRLLLAKQLLTETHLPVSEVASASGFASLRRFNDAFSKHYGMAPTRLRKAADSGRSLTTPGDSLSLQLTYRPPLDWRGLLHFIAARALKGVEWIDDDTYARTVCIGGHTGWLLVRHAPERRALAVEVARSLTPVLSSVLTRLRHMLDVSARPDVIEAQLTQDAALADAVRANPGLRVPGAFDGFELALRAILGQQISVKAATTVAGRFVDAFGDRVETPFDGLTRSSPTAQRVAALSVSDVASLGITRARASSIIALAEQVAHNGLRLEAGAPPDATIQRLVALPGVGPWSAHYIAMRALRWPDAFPKEDMVVRKRLGGVTPAQAEARSQAWRPWRSYATLHLWQSEPAT